MILVNNFLHYNKFNPGQSLKINEYFRLTTSFLIVPLPSLFLYRSMLSSRCLSAARAAYYGFQALTNDNIMKSTTPNTSKEMAKSLAAYALDPNQGIPQHKEAIITHITNQTFNPKDIYPLLMENTPNLTFNTTKDVDPRVLKELPVIQELSLKHSKDIHNIHVTGDQCTQQFGANIQANPDLVVTIKTNNLSTMLDNALGFKTKVIPLDEKGGMGMFNHVTKGTLGLITYDTDYKNIQMTNNPITGSDILKFNRKRLNGIHDGLNHDKIDLPAYKLLLEKHRPLLDEAEKYATDFLKVMTLHDNLQYDIWNKIQCHPYYNRSVSLLFIKQIAEPGYDPIFDAFRKEFVSLLDNRMYNLDKQGDRRDITRAMLIAYHKKVDPLIMQKLQYLKNEANISFNAKFIQDLLKTFQ